MFTRVGISAYKTDLDNTIKFCAHLNHPEEKFKSIHVAGTNGKGSTSHMLAAILQKAGYKTGLYTSPHLKDFRERIRINGEMISGNEVVDFVSDNQDFIESLSPSFFEATVALAFDHFAKHQVDIAVIEVGLGGRLDSTNVITPELSVITNISYDHMNLLGNTLPEIAAEKAGIIKRNIPVVIGELQEDIVGVFLTKAQEQNSKIRFASNDWEIIQNEIVGKERKIKIKNQKQTFDLSLDLLGTYQLKNIKTVLTVIDELNQLGYKIFSEAISSALSQVKNLTGLMGRWQTLSEKPFIICDTGHNEDGIKEVLKNINSTPHQNLLMVIGMVKDKDISKILSLLPKNATYYFCAPILERAKPAKELETEAASFGLKGESFPSVLAALNAAKEHAKPGDLIFVGGSTFVVAEVI
nr:bifunctional folylpolyglutamate synthase/dihydrofolate synthase [Pseudopedobacter sp.]